MQVLLTSETFLYKSKQNTIITYGFQNTYKTMCRINDFGNVWHKMIRQCAIIVAYGLQA